MTKRDKCAPEPGAEVVWLDDIEGAQPPAVEKILSIENVAESFGISRLLLRYFDFRGLIKRRHSIGRVRVYSWADCDRIAFIVKCRRAGLKLSEIVPVLKAADDDVSVPLSQQGQSKATELIDRLERRKKPIDDALGELVHIRTLLATKQNDGDEAERR